MKKLKVNYYLKGDKKNAQGEIAIYGKLFLGREKTIFSTAKYILKERWDRTNGLKNTLRVDNEISLKNYLKSIEDSIEKKYIELLKSNDEKEEITPLYLKNSCFNKRLEYKITLLEIVDSHNEYFKKQVKKGDRADGSLEKYRRMGEVIKDFLKCKYKLADITFENVDRQFVFGLDEFLRFERIHGRK